MTEPVFMPLLLQHAVVLLIVAAAAAVLLRQAFASFWGRGSKLGSCCSKGCDAQLKPEEPTGERLVFLPVDSLTRNRSPRA